MKNFRDQLALVTGGSSGIGLALSKRLAQMGASVWIAARRLDVLKTALVEIEKYRIEPSQRFGIIQLDISDEAQVKEKLGQFLSTVGAPDLLINNAGLSHPGEILEQESEIFRQMIDVNYLGTLYVVQTVVPAMVAHRSGYIVNIASGAAFIPVYGYGAYGASKFAVRGFSDVLRSELKNANIQVSVVMPADVDTPQYAGEKPYLPPLTQQLVGDNEVLMKPEAVAEEIIRGIRKSDYLILPGFFMKLYYFLYNFGTLGYWIMDLLLADAQRKLNRTAITSSKK